MTWADRAWIVVLVLVALAIWEAGEAIVARRRQRSPEEESVLRASLMTPRIMIRWRDVWCREFAVMLGAFLLGRSIYELLKWAVMQVWQ